MTALANKPIGLADVFVGMARKYNHFQLVETAVAERGCKNCVRRQFSYPDTCNDGWPLGSPAWVDRGSVCGNWTSRSMEPTPRINNTVIDDGATSREM
jgi:hypothetical protein